MEENQETLERKFEIQYFEKFGNPISKKNSAYPIMRSILEAAWSVDKTNNLGVELYKKLETTIEEVGYSLDALQEIKDQAKIKVVINDPKTAQSWWKEKRHHTAMLLTVVILFISIATYGLITFTNNGKVLSFYEKAEKESADGVTYLILKPSKKNFVIGENYITLEDGSIASPIHKN